MTAVQLANLAWEEIRTWTTGPNLLPLARIREQVAKHPVPDNQTAESAAQLIYARVTKINSLDVHNSFDEINKLACSPIED